MVFDSAENRAGGKVSLSPMQIAHHMLFSPKEKIDLLHRLKAEVSGALDNDQHLGFTPEEVDEAIEEVRLGTQNGVGTETVLRGDN